MEPSSTKNQNPATAATILEIAGRAFAEIGYDAVSLKDLATQTGIAKSTLFHHFPSKQDIYTAVVEGIFADLKQMLRDEAAFEASSPADRFRNFFRVFLHWLNTNPNRAKIMIRLQLDNPALARKFSKRFWVPTLRFIESTVLQLNRKKSADTRVFLLHVLNSMIHFIISLDSHVFLFAGRTRDEVIAAYEKQVLTSVERVILEA